MSNIKEASKNYIIKNRPQSDSSSWDKPAAWYNKAVGEKGHYYHQSVVIPGVIRQLDLKSESSLADLACGQGVLARNINSNFKHVKYLGVDGSESLINEAKRLDKNTNHEFMVKNLSQENSLEEFKNRFSHVSIVLALQNIKNYQVVIKTASELLTQNGVLVLVVNHPCFRIPRHSGWEFVQSSNIQYRRVSKYMSYMEIPIDINPSKGKDSPKALSFHFSLTDLMSTLSKNGFVISGLEEWLSDKTSIGTRSKAENTSRAEIPLFLAIKCKKASL